MCNHNYVMSLRDVSYISHVHILALRPCDGNDNICLQRTVLSKDIYTFIYPCGEILLCIWPIIKEQRAAVKRLGSNWGFSVLLKDTSAWN